MTRYVADTNVVSELMRPQPDARVLAMVERIDQEPADQLVITAVTRAELRYGVALLPASRRRDALNAALDSFGTWEVLPFGSAAADVYGEIAARRRHAGLPVPIADTMIAAIAVAHDATLLTRNVSDVGKTGAAVVDPWMST